MLSKKQKALLDSFPSHLDLVKEQLQDIEFAREWLEVTLKEYSQTKNIKELIMSLKPLIEAQYSICEFAEICGIHRLTLYRIFSRKSVPSLETLNKIFSGLGYELALQFRKL
jgi:DNA-binding phage protein